mmetsp:Transcript_16026/g.20988  ORF Transcript_16026/g.20988 Transcript_16026/m.20988 type:complete len:266 (-) Transcript_16026:200-997(-)
MSLVAGKLDATSTAASYIFELGLAKPTSSEFMQKSKYSARMGTRLGSELPLVIAPTTIGSFDEVRRDLIFDKQSTTDVARFSGIAPCLALVHTSKLSSAKFFASVSLNPLSLIHTSAIASFRSNVNKTGSALAFGLDLISGQYRPLSARNISFITSLICLGCLMPLLSKYSCKAVFAPSITADVFHNVSSKSKVITFTSLLIRDSEVLGSTSFPKFLDISLSPFSPKYIFSHFFILASLSSEKAVCCNPLKICFKATFLLITVAG